MDLRYAKILYPLDPGIYNKRVSFLSINNIAGDIVDVTSAIDFYPCYVPLDQSLATLTITSADLLNKMKSLINAENSIIFANLHGTKRKNDYVTYGMLDSKRVSENVFKLYNYASWMGLVLNAPQIMQKTYNGQKHSIPISIDRYFHIENTFRNGKLNANFSYSVVLAEFSKDDYHDAKPFTITYFSRPIELISLFCTVMQFNGKDFIKARMRVAIKKDDYRKLINTDIGLKILSLYTIYNITSGNKAYPPLNLVMGIYDFKYSMEEFALFVGKVEKPEGLTASIKFNLSELGNLQYRLSSKILPTPMDINMELIASKEIKKNGEIAISIIKPEIIIKLITAYAITSNDSIRRVLESGDLFDSIIRFYNRLGMSKFDEYGALMPGNISSYLLEGLN